MRSLDAESGARPSFRSGGRANRERHGLWCAGLVPPYLSVVGTCAPITAYHFMSWAWSSGGAGNASNIANATTAPGRGPGADPTGELLWLLRLPVVVLLTLALVLVLVVRRHRPGRRKPKK